MAQLKSFHFGAQAEVEADAEAEAEVGAGVGAVAGACIDFFYSSAGATKY